jgi:5-methylcytosine-specific restriction endonuclease McrA
MCQNNYQHGQRIFKWLHEGEKIDIRVIKRYLRETREYKCVECGISDSYNNKPITLELEHIDGNSDNNNLENLCWLCPNCHSQTSTYKAKNKGNGRAFRMKRYHEGKSY